jgi:energy-coupling factor transporter ATP-binding protein EcfA2
MCLEVFLPQPQHFMQPGIVGAQHRIVGGGSELAIEHRAERVLANISGGKRRREAVVAVATVLLFLDEPGVLEEAP